MKLHRKDEIRYSCRMRCKRVYSGGDSGRIPEEESSGGSCSEEEKKLREAEYEAGYDSGRQDGLTEGELRKAKETAAELAKLGMASTQIADVLKTEEAVIFQWLEECAK